MIHHWECKRCTHQWCSSCMGEMLTPEDQRERRSRQTSSHLCWDCFEKLEAGDFGVELREIYYLYHKLQHRSWSHSKLELLKLIVRLKSHEAQDQAQVEQISEKDFDMFDHELGQVVWQLSEVYSNLLEPLKTPARIELDRLKEEHRKGQTVNESLAEFWQGGWRPEGFVGDPGGEERTEVLFGLDLAKGNLDITPPRIKLNDGTDSCDLPAEEFQLEAFAPAN